MEIALILPSYYWMKMLDHHRLLHPQIIPAARVISPTDYYNTIISCRKLSITYDDHVVSKHLNLSPLFKKPLLTTKYSVIMERCLWAHNRKVHYNKGIVEYFHAKNRILGLHHFTISTNNGHKEALYLSGFRVSSTCAWA
ncbi:unnamed protein product [Eruca vesicaria subsp. sativa]|uniref:At2g35280-like TPR domain-containing protein n=1 Tax=Eruca vesicaria subsp. sativa TaxID=29727 RepID=A0ABC8LK62_ERUVS|nr:unnamed protein product [Eruca vesicaria subsp. sativa]